MEGNCCGSCMKIHFNWKHFLLDYPDRKAFVTPQWRWPGPVFVIYRLVVAIYFTVWIVLSGPFQDVSQDQKYKWFIFVTNWAFFMLTLSTWVSAITAVLGYVFKNTVTPATATRALPAEPSIRLYWQGTQSYQAGEPSVPSRLPWYLGVQWVIYNIATCLALAVSILYWGLLWTPDYGVLPVNFNTHAVNSMYVILDLFIIATPIRLLHFGQPLLFTAIYVIFNIIFQVAGGTDPDGNRYIYVPLDFLASPGLAAGLAVGITFIAIPLLWLLIFGAYNLRIYLNTLMCCCCSSLSADDKYLVVGPGFRRQTQNRSIAVTNNVIFDRAIYNSNGLTHTQAPIYTIHRDL